MYGGRRRRIEVLEWALIDGAREGFMPDQAHGPRQREVLSNPRGVAARVAEAFREAAQRGVEARDHFHVALAGGSTPRLAYSLMGDLQQIPWDRVQLFVGDERAVPLNHDDSNYRMIRETLLAKVEDLVGHVHPINPHHESLDRVSAQYQETLGDILGPGCVFDLLMLGLGEDGSTASLFPGRPEATAEDRYVVPVAASAQNRARVSVSAAAIKAAREVWVIATGSHKADVVRQLLEDDPDPREMPAAHILGCRGEVRFFLDQAAASKLRPEQVAS